MSDANSPVALITGGAVRLGRAIALGLAERGSPVAIHHLTSTQAADEAVEAARALGVKAMSVRADLAKPEQVQDLIPQVADTLGPVGLLVNSASTYDHVGFAQTDLALWQQHLDVNLTAPFLLTQAFARQAEPDGAVLNLLDWRALRPTAASFAYTVAKAGLAAMTQSLARDLAPAIRVNGLALGTIVPPPGQAAFSAAALDPVPANRLGTVDEVVSAALFLLTGPGYVTGEILHLDGGRHLV